MTEDPASPDRYHRQMLLPGIGAEGQARLGAAHALVVGCGALGCVIVDALARAGVGTLTIVDRDLVEITNLQRQMLYDERDVEAGTPKAAAAARRVAAINRLVTVHAHVEDFGPANAERLLGDADVIVDGLDNFETRYVLNDLAVRRAVPYVYAGAVGTNGVSMTVLPPLDGADGAPRPWTAHDVTPCLRCVFPDPPPPGASPTCDTAGVLGPLVSTVAAHQATQALKILSGNVDALDRSLLSLDVWTNEFRRLDVGAARRDDCPCCGARSFPHLEGRAAAATSVLCGRDAVQIAPRADGPALDLAAAAERLRDHGAFTCNEFVLRGALDGERGPNGAAIELTLFPDGRAIVKGVTEPEHARSIYARYVGI